MKYILCIIFIISSSVGDDYFYKVIQNIEVSKDFKNYTNVDDLKFTKQKIKKLSVRITLNESEIKKQKFYLNIVSDMDSLYKTNAQYTQTKNNIHIDLTNLKTNVLYFDYIYDEVKQGEFRCDIINEFEYLYMYPYEGIIYGVAYGIIFCAFLYYLIIFFSTNVKAFLYYSIMQFFVLLSLIGFVYVSFLSYPNQNFYLTQAVIDICETSAFLFTLLFTKEILNTNKVMPKMNLTLNLFVFLNILDIIAILVYKYSILYEYMRFDIGFLIPVIAGMIAIYKGDRFAFIYTFGWFIMFIFVNIAEDQIIPISGIYTIHIIAPFESLIFSFALGVMLRKLIYKQNKKEKMLIHKSRLASMGEMINNIAHQWKQPLTHLSYINMNLELASNDIPFDKSYLQNKIKESNEQIDFMSNTIDNFRDFYKPIKEKKSFLISKAVQQSIDIMKPILEINNVNIKFSILKDGNLLSYENEYSQVILNLITNAKDALISRNIDNASITIILDFVDNKSVVSVNDNAGGIKQENIEKIFEPYFTTKETGSGIGLYMSQTIIDSHFKGVLKVSNKANGACFQVIV